MSSEKAPDGRTEQFIEGYTQYLQNAVLPPRLSKDFHIVDCIKETPERCVYIIADKDGNRYVLKTGKGKKAEALWREFYLNEQLKKLPSLAIPVSLSCIETDDGCYLLNSYIHGPNLVQYQEKHAPLSEAVVISLMYKMCAIVDILHSQQPPVIHRDIKPENFILEKDTGVLYLVDLDTGRQFEPQKERDTTLVGTLAQAAPEQFGFSQSDVRTDIYGLGKSMLYLITGDTSGEHLHEYGISPALVKIIEKSTEFDPNKRYANVRQMMRDLKRCQTRHIVRPSYRPAIACSILFLLIGGGLGYFLSARHFAQHQKLLQNTTNAAETSRADTLAASDANSSADSSGKTAADNTKKVYDSLLDQANASYFEPTIYRPYFDAIILDYFNNDGPALAKDCEALVEQVKKDEELNRLEGKDYYGDNPEPDSPFWDMDVISQLRARIAYHDNVIYQNLGSYEKYQQYLLFSFGMTMSDVKTSNANICAYARGERSHESMDDFNTFSWILVESLDCITRGFDLYEKHIDD